MSSWFLDHRRDWIIETVRIFGFINREHIMRKFGVSEPQASQDLQRVLRDRPGVIRYDMTRKAYVPAEPPAQ